MTFENARTQGIHHAVLGGGPTQHMMLAIAGGIRLEPIAPVQS